MVVVLYRYPHLLQVQAHLGAQVEELVLGWDGMVAAMHRDVMPMTTFHTGPIGFLAIHTVAGAVDTILIRDAVEDIKFKLRTPTALIRNAS